MPDQTALIETLQQENAALRENERLYQSLFDMLTGFAYCRMLFENGQPQDFIYLLVNHAFEMQTGLKDVVGKRVTEVAPGIRETDPRLFEIYGRVALTGQPEQFEMFVEALHLWFTVSVNSPAPEHFVAVFNVINERKRIDAALCASEEKYRSVITAMSEGVVLQNAAGEIMACNPAAERILGLTPDQMMGRTSIDPRWRSIHADGSPFPGTDHPAMVTLRTGQALQNIIMGVHKPTGELTWISINSEPIYSPTESAPCSVVTTFADITDRNHAEEALRQSEANLRASERNFRAFFESSDQLLFVLDEQGCILFCNATVTNRLGYTSDELRGQSILLVHPPERRAEAGQIVADMLAGQADYCPVPLQAKDGRQFPVETRVFAGEWNGQPALLGVTTDLSALKASEEKFAKAFEASPLLMALSDFNTGRYLDVNVAFLDTLGYTHDEVIGQSAGDLKVFQYSAQRDLALQRLARDGYLRDFEVQVVTRTGQIRHGSFSAEVLQLQDRQVLLTIMSDITDRKQMEEALRESEAKFRNIIEQSSEGILLIDEQGTIIEWNHAHEQITGIPQSAALGQPVWDIQLRQVSSARHAQVTLDFLKDSLHQMLANGQSPQFHRPTEIPIETASGETRIVVQNAFPIQTEQGYRVGVIIHDITDRKRAEEALRESEAKYRLLFENMAEGFSLHEIITDEQGRATDFRFLDANAAYERHTGQRPQDIIGRTILEMMPQVDPRQIENYGRVALTGEPLVFEYYSKTFNRHLRVRAYCPQHGRFATIFEDITERKQMDEALRQSQQLYRSLVETSPDAIGLFDLQLNLTMINPVGVTLFGYATADEMIGHNALEFFDSAERAAAAAAIQQVFGQDLVRNVQFTLARADGTHFMAEFSVSLLRDVAGVPLAVVAVTRDITARKHMEHALRESEAKFRGLIERSSEGVILIDEQGFILEWNQANELITGISHAEAISQPAWEIQARQVPPVLQSRLTVEFLKRSLLTVLATGQSPQLNQPIEMPIQTATGELRTIVQNAFIIPTDQGNRLGVVIHDITDRKRMEEALQQSEETLRLFVEQSAVSFVLVDEQGLIIEWNATTVRNTGVPREAALGRPYWIVQEELISSQPRPDVIASRRARILAALQTGQSPLLNRMISMSYVSTTGEQHHYEQIIFPIKTARGFRLGSVTHNVTARKQMEDALRESVANLNAVFDATDESLMLLAPDGSIHALNAITAQRMAQSRENLIGRKVHELVPAEVAAQRQIYFERVLRQGEPVMFEDERDGRWLMNHFYPILEANGRVARVMVDSRDITDSKRLEQTLRDSEERFRQMFMKHTAVMLIVEPDTGAIMDANYAAEQFYGYPLAQLCTLSITDLNQLPFDQVHRERQSALREEQNYFVFPHRLANGDTRTVEVHSSPIALENKRVLFSIIHDITARKQAEEALRASETLLRTLIDALPERIFAKDTQSRFTLANAAEVRLDGATSFDDLRGKTDFDVYPIELAQQYYADEQQLLTTGQPLIGREEQNLDRAAGTIRWQLVTKIPLRDDTGRITGLVGTSVDITARKQMEEALRASEQKHRLLFETMAQGVLYYNASGKVISANPAAEQILGLTLDQLQGKTFVNPAWKVVRADGTDLPQDEHPVTVVLRTGQPITQFNLRVFNPNYNVSRWLSVTAIPLFQAGEEKPVQVYSTFEDITARTEAEEALRESEEKFRTIIQQASEGVVLLDEQGLIIEWNPAQAQITGISRAEALGLPAWEIQVRQAPLAHRTPAQIAQVKQALLDLLATGQSPMLERAIEGTLEITPGKQRHIIQNNFLIKTAHGHRVAAIVHDMTERKRTEDAERAARQLAEALRDPAIALNSSLELEAVLDKILRAIEHVVPHAGANIMLIEGEVACVTRVRGRCEAAAIGIERHTISATPNLRTMRASGEPLILANTLDNPDWRRLPGHEWMASYAGVPIRAQGQLLGFLGLYSDQRDHFSAGHLERLKAFADQAAIAVQNAQLHARTQLYAEELEVRVAERTAELQAANVRLTELDRLKDDFLSRISHELRTPLTGILIALELLETSKPERRERYVQRLKDSAFRMRDLIEDVLMFSQLNQTLETARLDQIDVNDWIEGRLTTWQTKCTQRNLAFQLDLAPDLPGTVADPELMLQVLTRLLTNAVNYTPAGTVTISTAWRDEAGRRWVTIGVTDTGPGLTASELPHIFERFYRGHAAADYKTPGSGVGLTISREITERLGGRLTVETQVGVGSTFTLWLRAVSA